MKKILFLLLVITGCTSRNIDVREKISLAGEWSFKIDSLDEGISNRWYETTLPETVRLPGSMAENGKGDEVTLKTDWTGDIIDKTYFTEKGYSKYRQPDNIKIPFWLKPVKYYKGAAWYQKEFDLPASWDGKEVTLFLERPHWESTVFVNGKNAGTQNSLATAHQFDISSFLIKGRNSISIRMDNRMVIPIGVNSHSISDHTQGNWNGIAGDISLRASSKVYISDISVYPDLISKKAKVIVSVTNKSGLPFEGKVKLQAVSFNSEKIVKHKSLVVRANSTSEKLDLIIDYPMGRNIQLWSEFNPSLYNLSVVLEGSGRKSIDADSVSFGMREFKTDGTRFEVNGQQIFLRGTTECNVFPLTGYPPTDVKSWERILQICKDYGLNHMRFHSYCPPEAAFTAADKLGIYFHVECSSWANQGTTIGDGATIDKFIYEEGDRIIKEYGNHPSFCMLAYGNEPAGKNQKEYLGKLLTYWKAKDNRHVYTSAAGWPVIPENDYNLSPDPRIQAWGAGLKSIINGQPPQTMYDFRNIISKSKIPVVSHEIGQWCVYPDFKEIEKYTGILKATNFEIFRETLSENKMGDQAEDFLMASGKLQALCYKAEVEAALRTPGFAGFELLQLHDFPGQGTALVGILNPFFESKGYITPEEWRMFCSETVPLARMKKMVYSSNDTLTADIEIAHFGSESIKNATIEIFLNRNDSHLGMKDSIVVEKIDVGNCIHIGTFKKELSVIKEPQKLTLEVKIKGTKIKNSWDIWVYPEIKEISPGKVLVTDKFDKEAESELKKGGSVLLLTYGKIGKEKGEQVAIGFSSIFWNTAWTNNQAPHTLGILCNPKHPLFIDFPTEFHSNWQWWDPVSHSQAMILDGFPENVRPIIQPIDTWFSNRRLGLVFEASVNGGKMVVCSIDLNDIPADRLVSKHLMNSIIGYMNNENFNPEVEIDASQIRGLMN
jgi:hypothetical protein